MGKWNRRYYPRSNRRSRYRDYDWSPPRETYRDPEFGVWQDNVPMWEKKFCFLSGVPWEKVLSTNKFMHCHSNIVEWDDTAGKEAFHNAKECYRAQVNGGQCEIHPPGPDAYIAEIDWNPYIDPELIEDLDRTFFVPDDKESRDEDIIQDNKFDPFSSLKDPSGRLDKSDNPRDCDHKASKDKAAGWNQWDDSVDTGEEPTNNSNPWECYDRRDNATINHDDKDNPWERGNAQTSQVSKDKATIWNNERWDDNNSWQLKNKSAGWNRCNDHANATEKRSNYGNSWGYRDRPGTATNKYGSRDWEPHSHLDNGNKWRSGNNQCETGISRSSYPNGSNYSANQAYGGASKDRKNDWGQKQCGQYGWPRRGGFVEERGRKREGPGQNMPGYKGPKLQYTDQSSRRWNHESSNKRVSFEAQ